MSGDSDYIKNHRGVARIHSHAAVVRSHAVADDMLREAIEALYCEFANYFGKPCPENEGCLACNIRRRYDRVIGNERSKT